MAATVAFLQSALQTSSISFTFSSQNLGAAAADRYIAVVIGGWRFAYENSISSVSVAGQSATIACQVNNFSTNCGTSGIAIAAVPTGTTGDVVVTMAGNAAQLAIGLYRVTGIDGVTAYDTDTDNANSPSTTIDIPAGGICIGGAWVATDIDATWAGITEDYDETSTRSYTGASDEFATLQSGLTVSMTGNPTGYQPTLAVASWAPAATIAPVAAQYYRRRRL